MIDNSLGTSQNPLQMKILKHVRFGKIKVGKYRDFIVFGRSDLLRLFQLDGLNLFNFLYGLHSPKVWAFWTETNEQGVESGVRTEIRIVPLKEVSKFVDLSLCKHKFQILEWLISTALLEMHDSAEEKTSGFLELLKEISKSSDEVQRAKEENSSDARFIKVGRIVSYVSGTVSIDVMVAILADYGAKVDKGKLVTWMIENEWLTLEDLELRPSNLAYQNRWLCTTVKRGNRNQCVTVVAEEGMVALLDFFCLGWRTSGPHVRLK